MKNVQQNLKEYLLWCDEAISAEVDMAAINAMPASEVMEELNTIDATLSQMFVPAHTVNLATSESEESRSKERLLSAPATASFREREPFRNNAAVTKLLSYWKNCSHRLAVLGQQVQYTRLALFLMVSVSLTGLGFYSWRLSGRSLSQSSQHSYFGIKGAYPGRRQTHSLILDVGIWDALRGQVKRRLKPGDICQVNQEWAVGISHLKHAGYIYLFLLEPKGKIHLLYPSSLSEKPVFLSKPQVGQPPHVVERDGQVLAIGPSQLGVHTFFAFQTQKPVAAKTLTKIRQQGRKLLTPYFLQRWLPNHRVLGQTVFRIKVRIAQ